MSKKHSLAQKKKWASIPPEVRSKRMRKVRMEAVKRLTPTDRKRIGKFLTNARKAKGV